jgi:hypothetical protein
MILIHMVRLMIKPENKNGHTWVESPPGTAPGWVCSECGYREKHKASNRPCGDYVTQIKPALHQFDPYADND